MAGEKTSGSYPHSIKESTYNDVKVIFTSKPWVENVVKIGNGWCPLAQLGKYESKKSKNSRCRTSDEKSSEPNAREEKGGDRMKVRRVSSTYWLDRTGRETASGCRWRKPVRSPCGGFRCARGSVQNDARLRCRCCPDSSSDSDSAALELLSWDLGWTKEELSFPPWASTSMILTPAPIS